MRTDFSGREVVTALTKNKFYVVNRTGSHVKLRYEHPSNEDDVRVVSVPMHDSIAIGTLRTIADQSGAVDFEAWCAGSTGTGDIHSPVRLDWHRAWITSAKI